MLATAHTIALVGLEPHSIRVEVESSRGPACFDVVGLPETTVKESRVRVRAALGQLGIRLSSRCVTVNLAPADLRKTGSGFDLAIAVATLAALGEIHEDVLNNTIFLGELSLTAAIQPIRGVLPRLVGAHQRGIHRAIVPRANGAEAFAVAQAQDRTLEVRVADDLKSVLSYLRGQEQLEYPSIETKNAVRNKSVNEVDLADVIGQPTARRALEIAAAGGHNLLMIGPPGAGKTMLAQRFTTILPPLEDQEALEVTAIHSIAGILDSTSGLVRTRPFRAPHHSVSDVGLLGGGDPPRPGELSLAHGGVLFLDELPEFRRSSIEGLRQPLEEGTIAIARAKSRAKFPARPIVIGAMNPCPCGFSGIKQRCHCSLDRIRNYRARISGPIVDRIDIHVALPNVSVHKLVSTTQAQEESSAIVQQRVFAARSLQKKRFHKQKSLVMVNAQIPSREIISLANQDACGIKILESAIERLGLSARAYGKVLRIARTIADLENSEIVRSDHIAEAIQYRILDRQNEHFS